MIMASIRRCVCVYYCRRYCDDHCRRQALARCCLHKIIACKQHLKKPGGGKLSDNERNETCDVGKSFVTRSTVCSNTRAHFTDQDCVSYVYHRTLQHIEDNKRQKKEEQRQARPEK
jgi:hypothetical protein